MANLLLYLAVIGSWSFTWLAIKFQTGVVPIEASVGYRFILAGMVFSAWMLMRKSRQKYALKDHLFMALQGMMMFAFNFVLIYNGSKFITSGLVALTFSMLIFFNILNGAIFLKKKIEGRTVAGASLGLIGMLGVFWQEFFGIESYAQTLTGVLLVLAGTYLASVGNITASRNQSKGISVVNVNAHAMCYGGVACFIYTSFFGGGFAFDPSITYIGSLLFLTFVGTVLGFSVYFVLMKRIGADKVAYALVVVPIVALTVSSFTEGYQWSLSGVLGVCVIAMGNILVLWKPKKARVKAFDTTAVNINMPMAQEKVG